MQNTKDLIYQAYAEAVKFGDSHSIGLVTSVAENFKRYGKITQGEEQLLYSFLV